MKLIDMTGRTFGRLTAKRYAGNRRWECVCECGVIKSVSTDNLKSGQIKSCGCLFRETLAAKNTKHGWSNTPTYKSWATAKDRCTNPNTPCYPQYGGRGIKMSKEWADNFMSFLKDMGPRPPGKTLDRRENDGNYEPGNCRWATAGEQADNRRTSRLFQAFGELKTISGWLQDPRCRVQRATTLRNRIVHYGWSAETAITTPVGHTNLGD